MQNNYTWEAERPDGTIITEGDDIKDCVRFSLIPNNILLQRFDLIGIKMNRRFCRGFLNGLGGGYKDYIHCLVCDEFRVWISYKNGKVWVLPPDFELRV